MPEVFHHRLVVQPSEIDGQGHANNVVFVQWMQDAALAHSAAQGWPPARYRESGFGWVARSHHIEYLQPAFVGDELIVQTWVSAFERVRSARRYEIVRSRDEVLVAKAETNWAFLRFSDGRPIRIPSEVADAFIVVSRDG